MYKIKFIPTGHIFLLPELSAKELKENYPDEYLILEKNGKKFKDKIRQKSNSKNADLILHKILEV